MKKKGDKRFSKMCASIKLLSNKILEISGIKSEDSIFDSVDCTELKLDYDINGNPIYCRDKTTSCYYYDEKGHLIVSEKVKDVTFVKSNSTNESPKPKKLDKPYINRIPVAGGECIMTHDSSGSLVRVLNPDGSSVFYNNHKPSHKRGPFNSDISRTHDDFADYEPSIKFTSYTQFINGIHNLFISIIKRMDEDTIGYDINNNLVFEHDLKSKEKMYYCYDDNICRIKINISPLSVVIIYFDGDGNKAKEKQIYANDSFGIMHEFGFEGEIITFKFKREDIFTEENYVPISYMCDNIEIRWEYLDGIITDKYILVNDVESHHDVYDNKGNLELHWVPNTPMKITRNLDNRPSVVKFNDGWILLRYYDDINETVSNIYINESKDIKIGEVCTFNDTPDNGASSFIRIF